MVKVYIWTEKAERRAQELNLEERKAGTIAYCGLKLLQGGQIAQSWLKSGYVEEAD